MLRSCYVKGVIYFSYACHVNIESSKFHSDSHIQLFLIRHLFDQQSMSTLV